jgi:uncharacterized membrane protein required for colicin V production
MSLDALPINVFDVLLLVVLTLGLSRGRKHGMSEELINLVQWSCSLLICAFAYEGIGHALERATPFGLLSCYLMAYLGLLLLIVLIFALVRRTLGGKLLGSDVFGKSEYYLGMLSGAARFACVLLVGLALLNARYFPETEVRALQRYQDDVYGSNFFPGLHSIQTSVFDESLTGPWIRDHLSGLLIKPTEPSGKELRQGVYIPPS